MLRLPTVSAHDSTDQELQEYNFTHRRKLLYPDGE